MPQQPVGGADHTDYWSTLLGRRHFLPGLAASLVALVWWVSISNIKHKAVPPPPSSFQLIIVDPTNSPLFPLSLCLSSSPSSSSLAFSPITLFFVYNSLRYTLTVFQALEHTRLCPTACLLIFLNSGHHETADLFYQSFLKISSNLHLLPHSS